MNRKTIRRWAYHTLNIISFLCVLVIFLLFCNELRGSHIAAELMAKGYPDLRGNHMTVFWIRLLASSGIGLFCHGLTFFVRPEKADQDYTNGREAHISGRKSTHDTNSDSP